MINFGRVARRSRYPSDTSDEQWPLIQPLLPEVKTGGRPEKHPRRALVDAILYVERTGCAWRQLPADFPPWQTVYWYFNRWEQYKVTEQILPVVREQLRIAEGRNPQPSAGLIDSQTVKGADTVGRESRGQNVAIGLTGLPDVPAKRTGATARWKSHWPSSAAVVAHTSRSQLSSSHRPIATRLTA